MILGCNRASSRLVFSGVPNYIASVAGVGVAA
jgi:hypothetical protein